jgi:hypothetical protein
MSIVKQRTTASHSELDSESVRWKIPKQFGTYTDYNTKINILSEYE